LNSNISSTLFSLYQSVSFFLLWGRSSGLFFFRMAFSLCAARPLFFSTQRGRSPRERENRIEPPPLNDPGGSPPFLWRGPGLFSPLMRKVFSSLSDTLLSGVGDSLRRPPFLFFHRAKYNPYLFPRPVSFLFSLGIVNLKTPTIFPFFNIMASTLSFLQKHCPLPSKIKLYTYRHLPSPSELSHL